MTYEPYMLCSFDPANLVDAKRGMRAKISPLIRIRGADVVYAQTLTDKRQLIAEAFEGDRFVWPWGGRWSTTVFELTISQVQELVK